MAGVGERLGRSDLDAAGLAVGVEEPVDGLGVDGLLGLPDGEEVAHQRVGERRAVRADPGHVAVGEALDVAHVDERVEHALVELDGTDLRPVEVVDLEQLGAVEDAAAPCLVGGSERPCGSCGGSHGTRSSPQRYLLDDPLSRDRAGYWRAVHRGRCGGLGQQLGDDRAELLGLPAVALVARAARAASPSAMPTLPPSTSNMRPVTPADRRRGQPGHQRRRRSRGPWRRTRRRHGGHARRTRPRSCACGPTGARALAVTP